LERCAKQGCGLPRHQHEGYGLIADHDFVEKDDLARTDDVCERSAKG
jgi:hypothetical protein